jgi:hypothetical protein
VAQLLAQVGGDRAPWGVHVAYGSDPCTEMTVMWSTRAAVNKTVVAAGPAAGEPALPLLFTGEQIPFSDVGNVQTLHRVTMVGLQPGTRYAYQVGDGGDHVSAEFQFSTQPAAGSGWLPTLAIYGDMGVTANGQATMPWLLEDALSGNLDVVVHIGDMAYNLDSAGGLVGDAFMLQIQPLAASVPYHMAPGNHETATDFYEYRLRLGAAMPPALGAPSGGGNGTFHSTNVGPLHVVLVSSEVYFSDQPHSSGLATEQVTWLAADLAAVDRAVTPWVILGLHQPFYCSPNDDNDDCHLTASAVRGGLERIIYDGGVDMVFGAHEHSYERNWPVFDSKWNASNTGAGAYVNPPAPVHILSGAWRAGGAIQRGRWCQLRP